MTTDITPAPAPSPAPLSATTAPGPTWYGQIRNLFTASSRACMSAQGLDLGSYSTVSIHSSDIYQQVATGKMPKGGPRWPDTDVTTFLSWMNNGCPKGAPLANAEAQPSARMLSSAACTGATRVRKDITTLSADELARLKQAFSGLMARSPNDPNSYFAQAGLHWYPAPNTYCMHHVPGFNPWHRGYLHSFEDALRSVPGCENVTLPYWDITTPFPTVLQSAPFDQYVLQKTASPDYPEGYVTQRYSTDAIAKNLLQFGVTEDIERALGKTDWEDFHGMFADASNNAIIAAHDSGHNAIGLTMGDQGVAAFDPAFWFFHCNWDRLYWQWQKQMGATDLHGLVTTINEKSDPVSYQVFNDAAVGALHPFVNGAAKLEAAATINSVAQFDVDYAPASMLRASQWSAKTQRKVAASNAFSVHADRVNVRVANVNRLKIPGSFLVHLQKDGKTIASKSLFQPVEVQTCANCVANAIVHFDFELPFADVVGGTLSVLVEPSGKPGNSIAPAAMGNPTIEAHLLLRTA